MRQGRSRLSHSVAGVGPVPVQMRELSPGADAGAQSRRRCGKSIEARTRTSSHPRGASVCERLRELNQLTSRNLRGTRQPAGKRVRARTRAKGPQRAREGYG